MECCPRLWVSSMISIFSNLSQRLGRRVSESVFGMQIRALLSSKMDGLRRRAEGCRREMGCSEICLTHAQHAHTHAHTSICILSLIASGSDTSCFKIPPPNKMVSSLYQFFCVVFPLSLISRLLCQALLKDFLIGGLCSYLIIWEVYSSVAC